MRRCFSGLLVAASCGALGLLAAAPMPASARPTRTIRLGAAPTVPHGASLLGELAGATPMHITVVLKPRDAAGLQAFATAVSTPGSGIYGRYITPEQFARRFGPTRAQVDAVENSLRAHGLAPGQLSANGLSIPVSATAGRVERAFSLSLMKLRLAGGGTVAQSDVAPALDASLAGTVQTVLGLTSSSGLHPLNVRPALGRASLGARLAPRSGAHVSTGGPQPCAAASAAAPGQSAYTTDQIASAYGLSGLYGAGDQGKGVTIALYELEPNDQADINAFEACYGISAPVSYVSVDGGAGSGAGSGEAALDIEQVVGLAPKASFIVYQGPNSASNSPGAGPYDTFSTIIGQNKAQVISVSWGQCERLEGPGDAQAESTLFQEAAAQGQSILAASGDSGSEDCDGTSVLPDTSLAVDDPGSQPFVTSVGGTTLTAVGPPPTESVWNNGGGLTGLLGLQPGAGGGGISALWPMPVYQSSTPTSLGVIQSNSTGSTCGAAGVFCREVPDVSANADPNTGYLIYFNGGGSVRNVPSGWQGTGGTSASAPMWSAVIALADASRACAGVPVGFVNPALYRAAASGYGADFNDVTSGNNDFTGTAKGRFGAGIGYDMASGLGTPIAAALATAVCANGLRLTVPSVQRSTVRTSVSFQVPVSDAPGSRLSFSASGLPAGLTVNHSTGKVTGIPSQIGTSQVTLRVSDQDSDVRAVSFLWVIGAPPKLSKASIAQLRVGRPSVQFTVAAGARAPALTRVVLALPSGLQFASRPRHLTVTNAAGKRLSYAATVAGGTLTIKLRTSSASVRVSIGYASLTATQQLISAFQQRRVGKLGLKVTVTDAGGGATRLTSAVKPLS